MSLLKEIGAVLGFVAFGGMAVLAFLTFQQARHLRRLREWAGRSPERAAVAAERVAGAASEATIARSGGIRDQDSGEEEAVKEEGPKPAHRLRGEVAYRWEELDKRSPVDPKILLAGLLAILVGVAILTSGFGLVGGSDDSASSGGKGSGGGKTASAAAEPSEVIVLNGTATEVGGVGVEGVASTAAGFVEDAGFKVSDKTNSPTPVEASVVMFDGGDAKPEAKDLASALSDQLGDLEVVEMTPEVQDIAGKAKIALVVGADDAGI
jgi:hypothetical protein